MSAHAPDSRVGHATSQRPLDCKPKAFCALKSIGTACPQHHISQEDAAEIAVEIGISKRYAKSLPTLYKQSGVGQRHSVLLEASGGPRPIERQSFYPIASSEEERGPGTAERMSAYGMWAPKLACEAATQALRRAQLDGSQITHLVTVSCSGFGAPGVDFALMDALELSPSVERTHIGFMGCHGALNGLRVARAICESQPDAVVLLCAVELCSLHQQYSDNAQQLVANALFSDGAAAVVFCGAASDASLHTAGGRSTNWYVRDNNSLVLPGTRDMMSWHVGDHGFEMTLSPRVPEIVRQELSAWLSQWLAAHDLCAADISNWAIHPGGPRVVAAVGEALELEPTHLQPSLSTLERYGNMSSPTVLFVLDQIAEQGQMGRYQVLLAFGPGLCIEAALLERPPAS